MELIGFGYSKSVINRSNQFLIWNSKLLMKSVKRYMKLKIIKMFNYEIL